PTTSISLPLYLHLTLLEVHSFPTRRSSDLGNRQPARIRRAKRSHRRRPGRPAHSASVRRMHDGFPLRDPSGMHLESGACGENRRDRKSTRLNSSHVSTSYAVFCLKKKK